MSAARAGTHECSALIFSEEYVKITKGMFMVWVNHARECGKHRRVDVLLNREHWGRDEALSIFGPCSGIAVYALPVNMPSSWLRRAWPFGTRAVALRAIRYAVERLLDAAFLPWMILVLYRRLRGLRPCVLFSHIGGWPAGSLGRWIVCAARLARIPKRVLIIHSHPMEARSRVLRLLSAPVRLMQARLISRCATAVVTVSDSVKTALEARVFRHPVARVHNGIDPSIANISVASVGGPPEWNPSGPVVGFVGALLPMKGLQVLLDAFKLVVIPCELALLGPGETEYVSTLRQRAELCCNKVSFLGFHESVDWFMGRIDLLVVPSISMESFGIVILEAMKHSKPVICSDYGGMKEVVENGVTGLVVPAGDAPSLAAALVALLTDSARRTRMGEAAHRRLNERFTAARMAALYDQIALGQ